MHPNRWSPRLTCPGVPLPDNFEELPVLSRDAIAERIANGELLVLHPPLVYKIPPSWLARHPGGDIAILHHVGRDASNEIEVYHSGYTVAKLMARWVTGRVLLDNDGWIDMVPPVQSSLFDTDMPLGEKVARVNPPRLPPDLEPLTPAYQHHLRLAQRDLHERLHTAGLLTPPGPLSGYGPSLVIYTTLFALFVIAYMHATTFPRVLLAAVLLGLFWHQVTFVAHDAGHTGLTGNWTIDRLWGTLIANWIGGLSIGWWCDNHNVHHLVTNMPQHDPDIQHLPFFAISTQFFKNIYSTYYKRLVAFDAAARVLLPVQHNIYYLVMCFARFNLFFLSYTFVARNWPARSSPLFKMRILEALGFLGFYAWFLTLLAHLPGGLGTKLAFTLLTFAVTSPLHVQIVLSHFSQPVSITSDLTPHAELLESMPHRQLRTTMDIECNPYLDFLHGGLHMQLSHHLFPRLPRFRFRAAQPIVKQWIREQQDLVKDRSFNGVPLKQNEGLVYKSMSFVDGNRDVLSVMRSVADQVVLLKRVAQKENAEHAQAHKLHVD